MAKDKTKPAPYKATIHLIAGLPDVEASAESPAQLESYLERLREHFHPVLKGVEIHKPDEQAPPTE